MESKETSQPPTGLVLYLHCMIWLLFIHCIFMDGHGDNWYVHSGTTFVKWVAVQLKKYNSHNQHTGTWVCVLVHLPVSSEVRTGYYVPTLTLYSWFHDGFVRFNLFLGSSTADLFQLSIGPSHGNQGRRPDDRVNGECGTFHSMKHPKWCIKRIGS